MHKSKINLPLIAILIGLSVSTFYLTNNSLTPSRNTEAATNWDALCEDGVYHVKSPDDGSQISCGRAPNCDGWSFDAAQNLGGASGYSKYGECWVGSGKCGPVCKGFVPLCCYKMAESGNIEDCPWEERKYCHYTQCDGIDRCGDAAVAYCVNIDKCVSDKSELPYIPLENRLAGNGNPGTNPTATTAPPQPTATRTPVQPSPTSVPPNQPTATRIPTSPPGQPTYTIAPGQPSPTKIPTLVPGQPSPTTVPTHVPGQPTSTTAPGQPSPTNVPYNPPPTGSSLFNFPTKAPLAGIGTPQPTSEPYSMKLPQIGVPKISIKNNIDIVKVEAEVGKTLGFFEFIFNRIKLYDRVLETSVNDWFIRAKQKLIP